MSTSAAAEKSTPPNDYLLYHQTLIPTQGVSHAIEGSFTLPNAHEVILIRHERLELWTLHASAGSAECVHTTPLLCTVQSIVAVPTTAAPVNATARTSAASSSLSAGTGALRRDAIHYVAMATSLGYLTLLRYQLHEPPIPTNTSSSSAAGNPTTGSNKSHEASTTMLVTSLRGEFVKVSEQCLGRSGARLTVPGARLAVDARGEALFVSALMRNRVVVPLVRTGMDAQALWHDPSKARVYARGDVSQGRANNSEDDDEDGDEDSDDERESGGLLASGSGRGGYRLTKSRKHRLLRVLQQPRGVVTLGCPLEVSRQTVVYSVCALEGFVDGCRFAVLEEEVVEANGGAKTAGETATGAHPSASHGGAFLKLPGGGAAAAAMKRKMLVVYAYNASVRQVQRTDLIYVPHTAHRLVAIPAEPHGPGGVLVCTETEIIWYDLSVRQVERQQQLQQQQDQQRRSDQGGVARPSSGVFKCAVPLPRRVDFLHAPYDPSIIQHAVTRVAGSFFLLLQDELGDLFRVVLRTSSVLQAYDALRARQLAEHQRRLAEALPPELAALAAPAPAPSAAVVNPLAVHYFDTIPVCRALALFRNGYLFAGVESAPLHGLYKVTRDGYGQESEYIVRHVQWVRPAAATNAATTVKAEPSDGVGAHGLLVSGAGVKRERDDSGSDEAVATAPPSSGAPGMLPPAPRPVPAAGSASAAKVSRAIALFKPHARCQHMVCMQTYPNTPAILSFDAAIPAQPGREDEVGAASVDTSASTAGPQQVEFRAVAGRGSDSVYVHAQYGCATRLESVKELPSAAFYALFPLVSADAVHRVVVAQQALLAATTETDRELAHAAASGATSKAAVHAYKQQLHALRHLAVGLAERCRGVGMDRVMLSSAQATAVYKVGRRVEVDSQVAFATHERTLAATTLEHGRGYVQITHKGVYLVPPAGKQAWGVRATHWAHAHGKSISAAAVNAHVFLVAFEGGGGVATFRLDQGGVALEQCGTLPTFPTATAVAVVQTPLSALTDISPAVAGSATVSSSARDLVAVATNRQQVFLFAAHQLTEPLERITCTGEGRAQDSSTDESHGASGGGAGTTDPIVSLLLTFLSSEAGSGGSSGVHAALLTGVTTTTTSSARAKQLFCLVGHASGALTLCELDARTAKVIHVTELTCGSQPCQLIVGDADTHCYVRSGPQAWRCALQGGVPKLVPWRFAAPQKAFAAYVMPSLPTSTGSGGDALRDGIHAAIARIRGQHSVAAAAAATAEAEADGEKDDDTHGEAGAEASAANGAAQPTEFLVSRRDSAGLRPEAVLALRDRQLSLFVAAQPPSASASTPDYSLSTYSLPLAGRRLLAHPTRPDVHVILNVEHRGHSMADITAYRKAVTETGAASALVSPIAPNAPGHSPGHDNHYASSVQLVDGATHQLSQPYYLQDGEAALGGVVGVFADLGREPILVLATADHYTHGAGCGEAASWGRGWLRAFRFKRVPVAAPLVGGDPASPSEPRVTLRLDSLHSTLLRADDDRGDGGGVLGASTAASEAPSAIHLCEPVGLLMVGMASAEAGLRIYIFGKAQFLRRRHLPNFPSPICAITTTFITPPTPVATSSGGAAGASPTYSPFFASDLYQCPTDPPEYMRTARERQLLIVCATRCASVVVASVQPRQGKTTPSFLFCVARDRVQRHLTSLAMLDERTMAVSDRFGHVTFLHIPVCTRFGFAEPIASLYGTELEENEAYIAKSQHLEEIASHHTGQAVTCLRTVPFTIAREGGAAVTVNTLFYATTLGSIGAFTPVLSEEDGALAAHVWPLMGLHARPFLQPGLLNGTVPGALPQPQQPSFTVTRSAVPSHNVVNGDVLELFRRAAPAVFRQRDRESIEDELEAKVRVERAQRERVLGLPARTLPSVDELVAKQRALATLPP